MIEKLKKKLIFIFWLVRISTLNEKTPVWRRGLFSTTENSDAIPNIAHYYKRNEFSFNSFYLIFSDKFLGGLYKLFYGG